MEGIKQLDGDLACKADDKEILESFPAVYKLSLKNFLHKILTNLRRGRSSRTFQLRGVLAIRTRSPTNQEPHRSYAEASPSQNTQQGNAEQVTKSPS
ncbi:hypothetical protein QQF64_023792 [Cirrhinus molitorella]|uniref:Uncharacterized protein n=1 Tax=Cirrhinus molitorella TaxID=172907 RepID=A0ABR3NJN0_9TELE